MQEYDYDVCDEMKCTIEALIELDEIRKESRRKNTKLQMQVKNYMKRRKQREILKGIAWC